MLYRLAGLLDDVVKAMVEAQPPASTEDGWTYYDLSGA